MAPCMPSGAYCADANGVPTGFNGVLGQGMRGAGDQVMERLKLAALALTNYAIVRVQPE